MEAKLIKTDSSGKELWQKIIGTYGKFDVGYSINELSDGYVAGGGLYGNGNQKSAVIKLDLKGLNLFCNTKLIRSIKDV